jgi:N-acetylneuraminate epimerase
MSDLQSEADGAGNDTLGVVKGLTGPCLRLGMLGLIWALVLGVSAVEAMEWRALPPIPDQEGFAAPFAGVHDGRLIVAGGANFPNGKPWQGGAKVWYDQVLVLDEPGAAWRAVGKLPRPLAYGVSISTAEGLIGIGGSDASRHYAEVFRLSLDGQAVRVERLPELPRACANMSGALVGRTIYVAGGTEAPDAQRAMQAAWMLNLDEVSAGWKEVGPWPGSARMLAAAGALDGAFYLVGGAGLRVGADGKTERVWLKDGYRFKPGQGWQRLADAPQVSVAAAGPMPAVGNEALWLIGGDDGSQVNTAPDDHQGFPRDVWAYQAASDAWRKIGEIPLGLVTTSAVIWGGQVVVTGGEKKPGTRSTEVWSTPLPFSAR